MQNPTYRKHDNCDNNNRIDSVWEYIAHMSDILHMFKKIS